MVGKNDLIKFYLMFLLFIVPIFFAQTETGPASQFKAAWTSSGFPWELLAIIAVFIGFSYSALAFMLSKVFSSSDLEKISKYEFLYSLSSIVLVVFIIGVVDILATKSGQFIYLLSMNLGDTPFMNELKTQIQNSGYSPFAVANFYFDSSLILARKRYQEAFCIAFPFFVSSNVGLEKGADLSKVPDTRTKDLFSFLTGKSPLTQTTNAGINFILSSLQKAMSNLSYMIYSMYFQKHLLEFIQSTMLVIFLPAGLVLRAFPFVRSLGNLLIAVSIGLYFVYPISYSLFIITATQGYSQVGKVFVSASDLRYSVSCLDNLIPDLIRATTTTVFGLLRAPFSDEISMASILNERINALVGELIMLGFVFPFLAGVITYTFIKSFSMVLNADVQEFAEGLVKLI